MTYPEESSREVAMANAEMAAAWDGDEGDHWVEHADRYEAIATRFRQSLLGAVPIGDDQEILDVGCGTGRSTREVAAIASSGSVLGIDLSARMLERARTAATAEGRFNIRFQQGDAQVHPFDDGAFDLAISAFGVMFFADPVAAFANIGRALRPRNDLAFLAWRELQHNDWVAAIRGALSLGRALPMPPPGAPGPFALADRRHTERVLSQAGFVDIAFSQVNEPMRFGDDADDAYSFLATSGITRGLTQDLDDASRAAALDALHATLAEHAGADGVLFDGSAWLVRARARGE